MASREETTGRRESVLVYRSVRLRVCILTSFYEFHKEKMVMLCSDERKGNRKTSWTNELLFCTNMFHHAPQNRKDQTAFRSNMASIAFHLGLLMSRTVTRRQTACRVCFADVHVKLFYLLHFTFLLHFVSSSVFFSFSPISQ